MENYVRPRWSRYFPRDAKISMRTTAAISAALGISTVWLGVNVFRDYGLALFTGVPICLGVLAPALHGIGARRSFTSMLGASILAQFALFCGILVFGIEGIVCILMAAPLWITLATIGTCIAYPIHVAMWKGVRERARVSGGRSFVVLLRADVHGSRARRALQAAVADRQHQHRHRCSAGGGVGACGELS